MPTYEYLCTACGDHTEVVQDFSDSPLEVCGVCGGRLRRVFHPVGVLFKGSGFYSTDSRSRKSHGSSKSDGAKSDGAKSDGGKSDGAKSDGAKSSESKSSESGSSKDSGKTTSEAS